MPTAIPTWRKVLLIPAAMPLCARSTTATATAAVGGFSSPMPTPPTRKPAEQRRPGVPLLHARHQDQAEARERQTAPDQEARMDPRHELAGDRRHDERGDRDREVAEARLERRVPEDVLEVERDVEEEGELRPGDRERADLHAGERRDPEQRRAAASARRTRVCATMKATNSTAAPVSSSTMLVLPQPSPFPRSRASTSISSDPQKVNVPIQSTPRASGSRDSRSLRSVRSTAPIPIGTFR